MPWTGFNGIGGGEMQIDREYIYIFVRKDLTPEQRNVQSCHAVAESGMLFVKDYDLAHPHTMILIGVKNEKELVNAWIHVADQGVPSIMFYEPDIDENTAFATRPVKEEEREIFRSYKTLKYERGFLYYLKVFFRSIKKEIFGAD